MSQEKKNQEQDDEPIRALDPIEHVRLRPGMYFGGIDTKALNNLVYGLLEYVMHQARQHACSLLTVSILGPQTLQIRDNGEGIPPHKYDATDKRDLESVMQQLARWRDGLGVWALAQANAASLHMHVEVKRDSALWEQHYSQGRKTSEIIRVRDLAEDEDSGTSLTFTIDNEIFPDTAFDAAWLEQRLFNIAHLIPGLKTSFQNTVTGYQITHYYPDGIARYLAHLNRLETPLYPPLILHSQLRSVTLNARTPRLFEMDVAMQFLAAPQGWIKSFAKALEIEPRGQHTEACFEALTDSLLGHSHIIKRSDLPSLFLYVTLVISLWDPGAMFESQTNLVLVNRDIHRPIYEEFSLALLLYFKEYPTCIPQLEAIALEHRKKRRYYPMRRI